MQLAKPDPILTRLIEHAGDVEAGFAGHGQSVAKGRALCN